MYVKIVPTLFKLYIDSLKGRELSFTFLRGDFFRSLVGML